MEGVPLVMELQGLTFVHFSCRWIAPEIFEPAGDCDIVQEESSFEDRSRPSDDSRGDDGGASVQL